MPTFTIPSLHRARKAPRRPILTTITTGIGSCCTSDDEDAITPCSSPPPELQSPIVDEQAQHQQQQQPSPFTSIASWRKNSMLLTHQDRPFDPTAGESIADELLWRRMLAIQRIFHCYKSARMSAALLELEKGEDVGRFMPSRNCLDLLNDSIDLSEDAKKELAEWLHDNYCTKRKSKKSSYSWRPSFHVLHAAAV